jgi:lipoprotein-anchoring transpeptidase ErfK/SrfK
MNKVFQAAALALAIGLTTMPDIASAATNEKATIKVAKVKKAKAKPRVVAVQGSKRRCDSFLQCLFGKPRNSGSATRVSFGNFASGTSLSRRTTRRTIDWNETKYPVGSIIVRTDERVLYYVAGDGEAVRYRVGVGREGFQWSGNGRIAAKKEWPSWTPPKQMIEREAEKGIEIPEFMEGGPGNPLGARALYIGGTIFRVHGTNNENSIGGAVSSGCIRMMNADVIDLYNRVKVGSRIYVYQ